MKPIMLINQKQEQKKKSIVGALKNYVFTIVFLKGASKFYKAYHMTQKIA